MNVETDSREVREDRVREPDSRYSIELRTTKVDQQMNGEIRSDVGLTKGSVLYQLANREPTKTEATRDNSLRVEP